MAGSVINHCRLWPFSCQLCTYTVKKIYSWDSWRTRQCPTIVHQDNKGHQAGEMMQSIIVDDLLLLYAVLDNIAHLILIDVMKYFWFTFCLFWFMRIWFVILAFCLILLTLYMKEWYDFSHLSCKKLCIIYTAKSNMMLVIPYFV